MTYNHKRITSLSLSHLLTIIENRRNYKDSDGNIVFIPKWQITRGMAVSEIGKIFLDENDHLAEHLLLSIMIYIKDVSHICYFYLSQRKEGLSPATLSFLERFEGDSLNISVINSTINIKL